jgi:hypothetical protein
VELGGGCGHEKTSDPSLVTVVGKRPAYTQCRPTCSIREARLNTLQDDLWEGDQVAQVMAGVGGRALYSDVAGSQTAQASRVAFEICWKPNKNSQANDGPQPRQSTSTAPAMARRMVRLTRVTV